MQTQNIIIFEPNTTEQVNALKALAKAFKIKFEVAKEKYSPEFVEKIVQGEKDLAQGKGIKMSSEDFRALCK